jgi:hypothetical protein
MGLAHLKRNQEKFQPTGAPESLERCRRQWMRVRSELAELKRAGSQQGLADLKSEAAKLSMQIKRFESILRLEQQTMAGPN